MATITNPGADGEWSRETAFGSPRADEHAKRFASARRHTRIVRFLRSALPVAGLGVVIVYIAIVLQTVGWIDTLPKVSLPSIIPENLAMDNPHYQGFNDDGGSYVVRAKTAVQDLTNLSMITLNEITGDLIDANKVKTNLKAAHGLFNSKTNELELYDGIDIASDSGMRAKLSRAHISTKDNVVTTKEPVTVEMPTGTIRSNEMTLRNKTREVTFLNAVTARLIPKNSADDKPAAPVEQATEGTPLLSANNGPIDITANRLDINDESKVATFSGAVHATQANAVLETSALTVSYESQGAPGASATSAMGDGAKIRRIMSSTPVVMTRAPDDRVTSDSLDFDALSEVAVLTGNVMMTTGADRQASGNIATIDQKADTIVLAGNVVVIQGRNELSGERLFVDRANARMQLSSPAAPGADEAGRIKTRFYRNEAGNGSGGADWQTVLASGAKAAVFKTDPNAPIDVEADRLDVNDRTKAAVFKGDVHAKQGEFVVRTAELQVSYKGQAGLAQPVAESAKGQPAQITRVEARGKVIVTSKNGQSATGDWANFDVNANKVTLGGDVVLTQDKNVVRGTRLLIDMVTGQSIIQNDPGASAWTATAAPKVNPTDTGFVVQRPTNSARPSAIFYPRRKDKDKAAEQPSDTQSPSRSAIGEGWEATSPAQ